MAPRFKEYNQNQLMLLPPDITDWIQAEHICFAINDVANNLDISSIEKLYSDKGCPAYNPLMLVKVLFYAYAKGIRSSRKIEELTDENIVFRYLSANQVPDHGTINLFRKNNLASLESIFAQIVILCDGLGMINPSDISIDGSVFKANASKQSTYDRESIAKLKKKIRETLEESDKIDEEEDKLYGKNKGYNAMPEKLRDPKFRQAEIKRLKDKLNKLELAEQAIDEKQNKAKTQKEKKLSKNSTFNTTDSDAPIMKMKNGKSYRPAYNGQVASSHQIIVAYEVSDENTDTKLLIPMIERTENNTGQKVKIVKADSIYFSKQNINELDNRKVDGYIPDTRKALEEKQGRNNEIPRYARTNFTYDQKNDEYVCPENKRLILCYTKISGVKNYTCRDCAACSEKNKCATRGKQRYLQIDTRFEKQKQAMRKKLNSADGKQKYLERMSEVEPVFGNITYNQNARNFLCRGKPMVKTEFGLSCIAHNLVKIANWIKDEGNKIKFDTLMRLQAAA
jgi:transposase